VLDIDRRKALVLLTGVAVAAIMSSIVLNVYSTVNGDDSSANSSAGLISDRMMAGPCGWGKGWPGGHGFHDYFEVSSEYEENVTSIAKNDTDVQALLNDGYNITGVRPLIKATVEASGDVVTKATTAIVMLEKSETGRASVWVDLEQGKVTKIEILTRTVIEKP
jgi:hypothetical protein